MAGTPEGPPDVAARRRVLELVRQYPGLHLREIQRQLDTSAMLAEYHLNLLEKWGLVTSLEEKNYRRFFPNSELPRPLPPEDKRALCLLRQTVPLGIILLLLERGALTHGQIADALDLRKSTLTYHLNLLEGAGVVKRTAQARLFELVEREHILSLLRSYRLTPDLIDEYAGLWADVVSLLWPSPKEP